MHITDIRNLSKNPVTATAAHEKVSDRYQFVSTENVMNVFKQFGWSPASQVAVVTRKADKQGFQKHMVRMENPDFQTMPGLTQAHASRPQLLLINSHDRGSSIRLMWGMIRFACLNGLVFGDSVSEVRLRHSASVIDKLPGAISQILNAFPTMQEQALRLSNSTLSNAAVQELIKTVYDARLEAVQDVVKVDYRLPYVRRIEDQGNDAFSIFNRLQEVAMRGGIQYLAATRKRDDQGNIISERITRGTTRAIKAIEQSVKINTLTYQKTLELVG